MVEARWLRWFGPGFVAVAALALIGAATVGAGTSSSALAACPGSPAGRIATSPGPAVTALADGSAAPWFRLDPVLDNAGALAGQRLALGLDGVPGVRTLDLPAESFAAGPFGRVVLVGADDGVSSTLRLLDVAAGCAWPIATERNVVRRATVDRERVGRSTRCASTARPAPTSGSGFARSAAGIPARQVLAAPVPDGRFGQTWSTEFRWDLDWRPAGGPVVRGRCLPDADRRPCRWADRGPRRARSRHPHRRRRRHAGDLRGMPRLPVPDRLDRPRDGRTDRPRSPAAGPAVVVATTDGARLVDEVPIGAGRGLRSVPVGGGDAVDLGPIPDDLSLGADAVLRRLRDRAADRLGPARPRRPDAGRWVVRHVTTPPYPRRSDPPAGGGSTMNATRRVHHASPMGAGGHRRRDGSGLDRRRCRRPRSGPEAVQWPVRTGPGPALPLAVGFRADRGDQDGDHEGGRRRQRVTWLARRKLCLRLGRTEPDRLRSRRDVWGQWSRLLHANPTDQLHHVAPRAGPRLRLGHAQVVPGLQPPRPTAATTPRRSRSTSSGTSRGSTTT